MSVLASLASVTAARAYQVWYRSQLTQQQMQDAMTQGLYEKAADSQEGVLNTVLSQMSDQHTKEVILAYAVLLLRGQCIVQARLSPMPTLSGTYCSQAPLHAGTAAKTNAASADSDDASKCLHCL